MQNDVYRIFMDAHNLELLFVCKALAKLYVISNPVAHYVQA